MTQITINFATILALLSSATFSDSILWMARAMDGEQGGCFPPEQKEHIGEWIGHTILNRLLSPNFPNDVESIVRGGFYGHVHAGPNLSEMYHLAGHVIVNHIIFDIDPTDGAVFMFSLDDLEHHGLAKSEAIKCFKHDEYGLCFFKKYPS